MKSAYGLISSSLENASSLGFRTDRTNLYIVVDSSDCLLLCLMRNIVCCLLPSLPPCQSRCLPPISLESLAPNLSVLINLSDILHASHQLQLLLLLLTRCGLI